MKDNNGEVVVKVVNTGDDPQTLQIDFKGLKKNQRFSSVEVTTLHNDNPEAENTLDNQEIVKPVTRTFTDKDITDMNVDLPGKTFAIYRFK